MNNNNVTVPRILVFSQRNASVTLPFRCPHFEFEDVIAQIDDVDLVSPGFDPNTRRHNLAKQLSYHTPFIMNPGVEPVRLNSKYELFFAVLGNPTDVLRLQGLGDWRSHCRTAVCLIDELWITQIDSYHRYLRMLDRFDIVILYYSQSIEPLSKHTRSRGMYLPPAVDALHFCPIPNQPERSVDVYSVGRRSAVTHQALLRMASEQGCFYLYDSIAGDRVLNAREHRALFANTAKRSRYFLAYPGLIDRPEIRGKQMEIGNRYFEGAASGAIMLGQAPENAEFSKLFDWPDPIVHLPYNSPDINEVMQALDEQPVRQEGMRRNNMRGVLLRHDWAHRWEAILQATGLEPRPALARRKEVLQGLAESLLPGASPAQNGSLQGSGSDYSPHKA
jgi:hypothetical protein